MQKKKILPVLIPIVLIILILGIAVGTKLIEKYSYSKETMDLLEYFHISQSGEAAMIHQNDILEEKALVQGGEYYLPLDFVQKNLNSRFYVDQADQLLLYTTPTQLYEIPLGSTNYIVSGQEMSHNYSVCISSQDSWYISLSFIKDYANFSYEIFENPDRIQVYTMNQSSMAATVLKKTNVRYQGGIKSDILSPVDADDEVVVLEEMENWSKVKTGDAIIGYVENKFLKGTEDQSVLIEKNFEQPEYTSLTKDYPINLAWHQVTNETANGGVDDLLANTKAINTISPTWFFLNDNSGNFTSIASKEYVDKMHAKNIEVWALIDNFTNDVDIAQILATLGNRKNLIQNLVSTSKSYQIDGINIDFEQVPASAGGDYVQFLRELSIACRENGLVLSVDNYVPTGYTEHYDRKEQGTVVDYVIIMGYDEHYSGSQEAGSVASIDYVKQGIEKTVAVVPSHKVINGIPFYTRLWKLADGVSSEALSMNAAQNALSERGVSASWDEVTCQNYASFEEEGITYQIWLEDGQSVSAKLSVMAGFNLGGVAEWKLGLEDPAVWDLISNYLSACQLTLGQDAVVEGDSLTGGSADGNEKQPPVDAASETSADSEEVHDSSSDDQAEPADAGELMEIETD